MKPGRELDALVAQKVLGWTNIEWVDLKHASEKEVKGSPPDAVASPYTGHKQQFNIPKYSSDIAAAWGVVEKVNKDLSFEVKVLRENVLGVRYDCIVWTGLDRKINITSEISAPHAICLAAIQALDGKSIKDQPWQGELSGPSED